MSIGSENMRNSFLLLLLITWNVSHCIHTGNAIFTIELLQKPCNTYTFDHCVINGHYLIEEVHDISINECQYFCSQIYRERCSFFIFKEDSADCLLFNETWHQFLDTCQMVGGPMETTIQECAEIEDPCKI